MNDVEPIKDERVIGDICCVDVNSLVLFIRPDNPEDDYLIDQILAPMLKRVRNAESIFISEGQCGFEVLENLLANNDISAVVSGDRCIDRIESHDWELPSVYWLSLGFLCHILSDE